MESEAPEGGPEDAPAAGGWGLPAQRLPSLSYDCLLFGVHYRTFLLSPNGKGTEAAAMEAHRGSTGPSWPRGPMRSLWRSPGPHRPAAPAASWADQTNLPGLGGGERMMEYADLSRGILL